MERDGFFVVQTTAGIRYTRNGSFRSERAGYMVTSSGDRVLGEQKPIQFGGEPASLSSDGIISQNGGVLARLQIVAINASQLSPQGNSNYAAPASAAKPVSTPVVRQGMLESSNLSPIAAIVRLILVQRQTEMLQRAFSVFNNDFNKTAVEELARV
jgi:flagellar basal-body rod protein FlgF